MGTRNLTMVIDKEGELKVAQYGQWDCYPEGQGKTILNFCKNRDNLEKLKKTLHDCKFFNQCNDLTKYLKDYDSRCQVKNENGETQDKRTERDMYWFQNTQTRDLGGKILNSIITLDKALLPEEHNGKIYLYDDHDFGKDSLFCEYAYCVNFQTNKLECFHGFNNDKTKEYKLFATDEKEFTEKQSNFGDRNYYGICLVKEYDLYKLPSEDQFIEELRELTEEGE